MSWLKLLLIAPLVLFVSPLLAMGQGDICVHVSNLWTGPDTAVADWWNTVEVWIANDEELLGSAYLFEFTFPDSAEWLMDGEELAIQFHGRASGDAFNGSCWVDGFLQQNVSLDQESPDSILFGGWSYGEAGGLSPGPSDLCYTFQFRLPASAEGDSVGFCILVVTEPPLLYTLFLELAGPYSPSFCGESSTVIPICFPIVAPPPRPCGDASGDLLTNITDAVYLLDYIFNGGPAPCGDCLS